MSAYRIRIALLGLLLAACPVLGQQAKPYQRAMIFAGGGTDFLPYIGMYDAAVDAGKAPDILVASSGGAIAATIIAVLPDRTERNAFLASQQFHELLLSIHVEHPKAIPAFARLAPWTARGLHLGPLNPHIWCRLLASKPADFGIQGTEKPFGSNPAAPKVVFVAGGFDFDKGCKVREGRKLFTETFFTDPATAAYLQGSRSAIAANYPRSAVRCETNVIDNLTIGEGLFASIAEPYIFEPAVVAGRHYTGGVTNMWPVEVADKLACEVVVVKQAPFSGVVETLISSVFEYSQRDRRQAVDRMPVAYRVDMADANEAFKGITLWFEAKLVRNESEVQAVKPGEYKPERAYLIPRYRIVDNVPEDRCEFHRRINAQWQYGYDRTKAVMGPCP